MAFERYVGETRMTTKPMVSVRTSGKIGLNRAAVRHYSIDSFTHVVLLFEAKTTRVGLVFTRNGDEEGAMRLCKSKSGKDAYVSAKRFLCAKKLLHGTCKRYPLACFAVPPVFEDTHGLSADMATFVVRRQRGRPRNA